MNLKNKSLAWLFLCVFMLNIICFAEKNAPISPALKHIEKNLTLKKCTSAGNSVSFCTEDFDGIMHSEVKFIKIKELPDSETGKLVMGTLQLSENQIVERENFDKITFSPSAEIPMETEFVFCNATAGQPAYPAKCVISVLEYENRNPVAENQSLSTMEDIAVFKFLGTSDPEDDELSFQVISYPSHGTLRITEGADGHFSYTPVKGFTGKDSFEYVAVDKYGNKSKPAKVSVNVTDKVSDIYFDDLSGHWAHNSAIKTASMGLMSQTELDGKHLFNPGNSVSRGDFLAMSLIAAGCEKDIRFVTQSSFSDDDTIPMNIKSYAEYAKRNGIVSGYPAENGEAVFNSRSPVTRAEAAVMLSRILKLDVNGTDINVFADSASVPNWAAEAMSKLAECGIMNGTGFGEIMPESIVTRAETAEIICNVTAYIER